MYIEYKVRPYQCDVELYSSLFQVCWGLQIVIVTQILTLLTVKGDVFHGEKFLIYIHYNRCFTVPLW